LNRTDPPPHNWRVLVCLHCGNDINVAVDCGDRFCPICSRRRAARIRRRLNFVFSKIQKKAGYRLKMITLSASNCQQLDAGIKHLVASFRRLRQRRLWRLHVDGGATIIEITGRPNDWHPHLHIICYSRYFPWEKLHAAWKSVSGGSATWLNNIDGDSACSYVTKYITKCDAPDHLHAAISDSLRKYRLFQRFGIWHSIVIPKVLHDHMCDHCGKSSWYPIDLIDRHVDVHPARYDAVKGAL